VSRDVERLVEEWRAFDDPTQEVALRVLLKHAEATTASAERFQPEDAVRQVLERYVRATDTARRLLSALGAGRGDEEGA
jgi:hypothetical protein